MIRINLLTVERAAPKAEFALGQKKLILSCGLILALAVLFIGWRYVTVTRDSERLDQEIARSQQEVVRLHSILQQVQEFEQRKAQLQQRVLLIEQLRKAQIGPVLMLEQISRSLPPMLWLTELKQVGTDVVIDGNCTTLTGLSDFVANLEGSGYFKRSIEIVSTTTEVLARAPGELIRFSIKAQFQRPGDSSAPAAVGKRAGG
jgi:type IV pilus assembly protein PilN